MVLFSERLLCAVSQGLQEEFYPGGGSGTKFHLRPSQRGGSKTEWDAMWVAMGQVEWGGGW